MGRNEELKKRCEALDAEQARRAALAGLRCAWELARDALGPDWGEAYAFIPDGVADLEGGEASGALAGQLDGLWPDPPEEAYDGWMVDVPDPGLAVQVARVVGGTAPWPGWLWTR